MYRHRGSGVAATIIASMLVWASGADPGGGMPGCIPPTGPILRSCPVRRPRPFPPDLKVKFQHLLYWLMMLCSAGSRPVIAHGTDDLEGGGGSHQQGVNAINYLLNVLHGRRAALLVG